MATRKMEPADEVPGYKAPAVGYNSVDRNGAWFKNNGSFVMEDPTNAGKGPLTRFEPQSFTQATETNWTRGQQAARVLTKYDGDPRDEHTKEVPFVEASAPAPSPTPTPPPTQAPVKR